MRDRVKDGEAEACNKVVKLCKYVNLLATTMAPPLQPSSSEESGAESEKHGHQDPEIEPRELAGEQASAQSARVKTRGSAASAAATAAVEVTPARVLPMHLRKREVDEQETVEIVATAKKGEQRRLTLDEWRAKVDAEMFESEIRLLKVESGKQRGLARQELRSAGVPEKEINTLLLLK